MASATRGRRTRQSRPAAPPVNDSRDPVQSLDDQIEFNRRRIRTDGYAMSIGEVTSIYQRGELDIHPEFQRYFRWTDQQKSDLVESILLGIPLPSIFVSQRADGVWDVVDGLQRLSTIFQLQHVLKDEKGHLVEPLTLTETTYLPLLKGRRWPETPEQIDDAQHFLTEAQTLDIKRAKLDLKIILRSSDPGQEYDLFQRLNTNGSPLSDQEVRNNLLIMANKDDFRSLKSLSQDVHFQSCLSLSDRLAEEQFDVELALRFLIMLHRQIEDFKKMRDLNKFLTAEMLNLSRSRQLLSADTTSTFKLTFEMLDGALGSDAFRRYDKRRRSFTGGFLVSAFEVIALGIGYNINKWRRKKNAATLLEKNVKDLWGSQSYLSKSRMGVPATTRIPETVSYGREYFAS